MQQIVTYDQSESVTRLKQETKLWLSHKHFQITAEQHIKIYFWNDMKVDFGNLS